MSKMFSNIEEVCAYINELLLITNGNWEHHLEKLVEVLDRLKYAGLKVNAQKSYFDCQELEYLGYLVTRQGIKPLQKQVEAVLKIAPPTIRKQLCSFIGMINYYCNMWHSCSKVLAPLAELMSKAHSSKWTSVEQKAFKWAKKIVIQEALLAYPYFNISFKVHTEASDTQLGAVISQCRMPVAFYLCKLNSAQKSYTTT
eukprot:15125707-Ditylum_brightwellii.AAC.1